MTLLQVACRTICYPAPFSSTGTQQKGSRASGYTIQAPIRILQFRSYCDLLGDHILLFCPVHSFPSCCPARRSPQCECTAQCISSKPDCLQLDGFICTSLNLYDFSESQRISAAGLQDNLPKFQKNLERLESNAAQDRAAECNPCREEETGKFFWLL